MGVTGETRLMTLATCNFGEGVLEHNNGFCSFFMMPVDKEPRDMAQVDIWSKYSSGEIAMEQVCVCWWTGVVNVCF